MVEAFAIWVYESLMRELQLEEKDYLLILGRLISGNVLLAHQRFTQNLIKHPGGTFCKNSHLKNSFFVNFC